MPYIYVFRTSNIHSIACMLKLSIKTNIIAHTCINTIQYNFLYTTTLLPFFNQWLTFVYALEHIHIDNTFLYTVLGWKDVIKSSMLG